MDGISWQPAVHIGNIGFFQFRIMESGLNKHPWLLEYRITGSLVFKTVDYYQTLETAKDSCLLWYKTNRHKF